jgi:hypothetical protein
MANMPDRGFTFDVPKFLQDRLQFLFTLPQEKWQLLREFVQAHLQQVLEDKDLEDEVRTLSAQLDVSRSAVYAALSFIGSLCIALGDQEPEHTSHLLAQIVNEAGLGSVSEQLKLLMEEAKISPQAAAYHRQKAIALQSILPTLDDVDIVCDLRLIFRRLPSPSRSEQHEESVKALLGFEPVAIMNLELSDSAGEKSVSVFQLTENGLRNLQKTLEAASAQFDAAKKVADKLGTPALQEGT